MSKHIDAELGLAYLDGRLDPAQRAKLERHLAECMACQAQLRQHQATHSLLQKSGQTFQATPVRTPAWTVVRRRQEKWAGTQTIMRSTLQLATVGAVAVLIVVLLLSYQPDEPTIEPAASSEPAVTVTVEGVTTLTPQTTIVRFTTGGALDSTFSTDGLTDPQPLTGDGLFVNPTAPCC